MATKIFDGELFRNYGIYIYIHIYIYIYIVYIYIYTLVMDD